MNSGLLISVNIKCMFCEKGKHESTKAHRGFTPTSMAGELVGFVSSIITLGTFAECCSNGMYGFGHVILDKAFWYPFRKKE